MPKMTFAIPCYNMEPWLPVCIESCLYQTEPAIEVLVVNDGSTDNSGAIADHYATQDNRVRVIHQTNQGHGKARQMAQDNATGEFILFLVADDFIDKTRSATSSGWPSGTAWTRSAAMPWSFRTRRSTPENIFITPRRPT
jgi:glycosyltransferase involved in cell wall biosynthesis